MVLDTRPSFAAPAPPRHAAWRPRALDRFLTVMGELLITAGVLVGLFVVWQLFYTDVQSERIQDAVLEEIPWYEPPAPAIQDNGGGSTASGLFLAEGDKHYTPDGAPVAPTPAYGEVFATMYVPRWGTDYVKPIAQGTTRFDVLDRLGIGHYKDTVMPGQVGNFAVAGHRTTYGKPFTHIEQLEVGDAVVVQTEEAWFVYRVTDYEIVLPTHIESIAPNPYAPGSEATEAMITLTACHPRFSAAQRYVVHGTLEYWAPTGVGFPVELTEGV